MPDKRNFIRFYRVLDRERGSANQGKVFTYGRRFAQLAAFPYTQSFDLYQDRRDLVLRNFNLPLSLSILMVGAGFGFLEEVFRQIGFQNLRSLDSSLFVKNRLISEATFEVRMGYIHSDILKDVSGLGSYDVVISEDIVSLFSLRDRKIFYRNCDSLTKNTIHLTQSNHMKSLYLDNPHHNWVNTRTLKIMKSRIYG